MQLTLRGYKIDFNDKEVELAKKSLEKYLNTVKMACEEAGRPTYYYTLLIVAYVMINDTFDVIDLNMMQKIFKAINTSDKMQKEKQ